MAQLYDFVGFQWDGIHSSDLNIVRTSDGSRYNETLIPAFQDTTSKMPGSDGTLYWESFYTNKPFNISIAFDRLTETEFRRFRQVFSAKKRGQLIFDEAPYKAYTAKIQSPPQLKYICFDEDGQRIYKGEGTIQFIAYCPYAKSIKKYLNQYTEADYPNKDEWAAASGLALSKGNLDGSGASINLFNPGDLPTDFCVYFAFNNNGISSLTQIKIDDGVPLVLSTFERKSINDDGFRINTRTNLIEGVKIENEGTSQEKLVLTGNLYNEYISTGDFFKIPIGESTLTCSGADCNKIEYDYLYY